MDLSPTKNSLVWHWLQEKNPYLAFKLYCIDEGGYEFPKIDIPVVFDTEIIFIESVINCFASIAPFLERGGQVIFVEKSLEKIGAFLGINEFVPHANITIITDEPAGYQIVAKIACFKKHQFVGELTELKKSLDEVHLALSEYQDLGKTILQNIQENLLSTKSFVHGKGMKGIYNNSAALICGSGPSLDQSREKIINFQGSGLIFAAGSAVLKLIEWGVRIDGWFFVDPWPALEGYEVIRGHSFPLFYQNRMSRHLFKMHQGAKIWMGSSNSFEIEEWIYREIGIDPFFFDPGWNAGCFALNGLSFLGCDSVTLIGMDGGERRDLKEGLSWMKGYETVHSDIKYDTVFGAIDPCKLQRVIETINDGSLKLKISHFLEQLKIGVTEKKLQREKVLLEAELICEPLFEYLILPLWNLLKDFYKKVGSSDTEEVIQMALFALRVLEFQQVFRFYPTGQVRSRVGFLEETLHGEFYLYAKNGVVLREGIYNKGKKEGKHTIRGEEGGERLIAEFKSDLPVNRYVRKNEKGVVVEEMLYQNPQQFDRRLYTDSGDLKSEGVFVGDEYVFKRYEQGAVVLEKKGIWKEGQLLWC